MGTAGVVAMWAAAGASCITWMLVSGCAPPPFIGPWEWCADPWWLEGGP